MNTSTSLIDQVKKKKSTPATIEPTTQEAIGLMIIYLIEMNDLNLINYEMEQFGSNRCGMIYNETI